MNLVKNEDIWEELGVATVLFVTASSTLNGHKLIMSHGAAKEAEDRFPFLPATFGSILVQRKRVKKVFGIMTTLDTVITNLPRHETQIGIFQAGIKYYDVASLDVIKEAVRLMKFWADKFPRIAMTFPGIGQGKLKREDVLPVIAALPDNVWVYEMEPVLDTDPVFDAEFQKQHIASAVERFYPYEDNRE